MAYRVHGSGAFAFEHIDHAQLDMGRTFFRQCKVLKPFAGLEPGELLEGISINPNSFECFYWHFTIQDRKAFSINELIKHTLR